MSDEETRGALRAWLADFRAAVMFLTRLPVAGRGEGPAPVWPRLMRAFPLAGALVGGISAMALYAALWAGLGPVIAALLALGVSLLATGALHEDGLADFADGLGGDAPARRLEIMRDSRIGAFGVIALILALALPAAALARIAQSASAMPAVAALVAAHAVSRLLPVLALRILPPARRDGAGALAGRPSAAIVGQAAMAALAPAAALAVPFFGAGGCLLALFWAALSGWLVVRAAGRLLGGHTGDVAGAAEVAARVAFLLALANR